MRIYVDTEDHITDYEPADNGAGPLWCHGSTIVVRQHDRVFVACLETLADQVPLNNTRWVLYSRRDGESDWTLVHRDESGRTREPSPIVLVGDQLLVSANPTLAPPGEYGGAARPTVFTFDTSNPTQAPTSQPPAWSHEPEFREHSYRTFVADSDRAQVLFMQNEGYELAHMSLLHGGTWRGLGPIRWPFGAEYDKPQPLRLCYPNVMLRNGGAHFLGVGDIVEPVEPWREAKKQITGREWDYVFRRLFYASTPNIATQPFGDWLELADRDATAGATRNADLWIAPDGSAHALWIEVTTDARLQERFFPDTELRHSLEYAHIVDGQVRKRRTLASLADGDDGLMPALARFHQLDDERVLLLAQFSQQPAGSVVYRACLLGSDRWVDVPFARPMAGTFLTNTVRAGCAPGPHIDIVGTVEGPGLGYARLRVET